MSSKLLYVLALLIGSISVQAYAMFLLPLTRGATAIVPTLGVMISFCIFTVLISRLMTSGMTLSILVPLLSAAGPLAAIAIGIFAYGEAASFMKLATLLTACGMVVIANFL